MSSEEIVISPISEIMFCLACLSLIIFVITYLLAKLCTCYLSFKKKNGSSRAAIGFGLKDGYQEVSDSSDSDPASPPQTV